VVLGFKKMNQEKTIIIKFFRGNCLTTNVNWKSMKNVKNKKLTYTIPEKGFTKLDLKEFIIRKTNFYTFYIVATNGCNYEDDEILPANINYCCFLTNIYQCTKKGCACLDDLDKGLCKRCRFGAPIYY
jgi:hypothetical protein